MEQIPFVTLEQATIARNIERKLLTMQADIGIRFVGCKPIADLTNIPLFIITVGCTGFIDPEAVNLGVNMLIEKDFPGIIFEVRTIIGRTKNDLT